MYDTRPKYCTTCKLTQTTEHYYCINCSTPLSGLPENLAHYCDCGYKIEKFWQFCPNCRRDIRERTKSL